MFDKIKGRGKMCGIGLLFVTIMILLFFPVKVAIKLEDFQSDERYFICKLQSTTGPNWYIIGDEKGMYSPLDYKDVIIEGVDPQSVLNNSVQIDSTQNQYVIYGEIVSQRKFYDGENYSVISALGFDMVYPIERGNSLRVFVSPRYLTVFDYQWLRSK